MAVIALTIRNRLFDKLKEFRRQIIDARYRMGTFRKRTEIHIEGKTKL